MRLISLSFSLFFVHRGEKTKRIQNTITNSISCIHRLNIETCQWHVKYYQIDYLWDQRVEISFPGFFHRKLYCLFHYHGRNSWEKRIRVNIQFEKIVNLVNDELISWANLIGIRIISYLIFVNAVRNILFVVSFRIIRLNQTKFIIYTYNVFEICNFFERPFQDFDYFYRGYIFYIPISDRTIFSDDTTDLSRNADNDGFQVSDRREWPINRWLLCAINYLIERFSTYHADKNERRECNTFEIWC